MILPSLRNTSCQYHLLMWMHLHAAPQWWPRILFSKQDVEQVVDVVCENQGHFYDFKTMQSGDLPTHNRVDLASHFPVVRASETYPCNTLDSPRIRISFIQARQYSRDSSCNVCVCSPKRSQKRSTRPGPKENFNPIHSRNSIMPSNNKIPYAYGGAIGCIVLII